MKLKKLIVFSLFFALSATSIQLAAASPAVDVASTAAKMTWEQWWQNHAPSLTFRFNPYGPYRFIQNYPLPGAICSFATPVLGFVAFKLYSKYYNWRAEKRTEICTGIQADLIGKSNVNKPKVESAAQALRDAKLKNLIKSFYPSTGTTSAAATAFVSTNQTSRLDIANQIQRLCCGAVSAR